MRSKRNLILFMLLFLAVGFASVSTYLYVNGTVGITTNQSDFDVYYSNALVDGLQDKSVIISDNTIEFNTTFSHLNDSYTLKYYITNGSKNYDANVSMNCTGGNDYVTITNNWVNETTIEASDTNNGTLKAVMTKAYVGDNEIDLDVKCTITANAVERTTLSIDTPDSKVDYDGNLYNLIKSNAKTDTIDFSIDGKSSETNGIYTTTLTENNVPVYYYRGAIDQVNNNVIFNNMCWKIIRTTETNGIKLIYNGLPKNGKCLATSGEDTIIGTSVYNVDWVNNTKIYDNAYVGYMYGTIGSSNYADTHANTNNSVVKTYIDNWYSTNFTDSSITSKIEDTVYCNDRSIADADTVNAIYTGVSYGNLGYGSNNTMYGAYLRVYNSSPSLVCSQNNDKFTVSSSIGNGSLTYPVGLITVDEMILAGFSNSYDEERNNDNNYLANGYLNWTMTPLRMTTTGWASEIYTISNGGEVGRGYIGTDGVGAEFGVRPVISLNSDVTVKGNGASTNPYVVQ